MRKGKIGYGFGAALVLVILLAATAWSAPHYTVNRLSDLESCGFPPSPWEVQTIADRVNEESTLKFRARVGCESSTGLWVHELEGTTRLASL